VSAVLPQPTLHHGITGRGPLLVLLHPIGLEGSWWQPYVSELSERFTVITPDLAGHGRSPLRSDSLELEDHAQAVARLICEHGGRAHVAGASMGGMVAQVLALQEPWAVESLSLISTMATVPDAARAAVAQRGQLAIDQGMAACIDPTVERWVLPGEVASTFANLCRVQLARIVPRSWRANWMAISHLHTLDSLSTLRCPVFVCTGERDVSTTPEMSRAMATAIGNPELHLVPGAAHMGVFEHVNLFLPPLQAFLHARLR